MQHDQTDPSSKYEVRNPDTGANFNVWSNRYRHLMFYAWAEKKQMIFCACI